MIEKKDIILFVNDVKVPKICKIYDDEVEKLLNNLKTASTIKEIRRVFLTFINSFTMIPELWILWLRLENSYNDDDESNEESYFEHQINLLGKSHFTFHSFAVVRTKVIKILTEDINLLFQQSPVSAKTLKAIEKTLCYPNGKKLLPDYKMTSPNPVKNSVIKSYQKALEFYNKAKDVEIDIEKWFMLLTESDDKNFIINTIEYRLSLEPNCVQLWELYIRYLSDINDIKCLDVYSRYCRLFIDDFYNATKYEKEIEKYYEKSIDVSQWWDDITEFERQFYNRLTIPNIVPKNIYQKLLAENGERFENWKKEKLKNFDFIKMKENGAKKRINIKELLPLTPTQKQYFSLPSPLILYILDNSSPQICHRVYETCKYFFNKKDRKPICHNFILSLSDQESKRPIFICQSVYIKEKIFQNHEFFLIIILYQICLPLLRKKFRIEILRQKF